MDIKVNVNLHNVFDIEVRDVRTNELKQTAQAFNLILDGMYNRLCNLQSFFRYISFGSGTGAIEPTRTTLFNRLASKAITEVERSLKLAENNGYLKRMIQIMPEEHVGATITEVGIGESNGTIYTHALIKDSEGNPISIVKTETDVVTIYATVFFNMVNPYDNTQWIGEEYGNHNFRRFSTYNSGSSSNNGIWFGNLLLNYLAFDGVGSYPNRYGLKEYKPFLLVGSSRTKNNPYAQPIAAPIGGSSAAIVPTADVANKRLNFPRCRLDVNTGNGPIKEISLAYFRTVEQGSRFQTLPLFRTTLPAAGLFTQYDITNESLGEGDGIRTEFNFKWDDIIPGSAHIFINGVEVSTGITINPKRRGLYDMKNWFIPVSRTDYPCIPVFSNDGKILSIFHQGLRESVLNPLYPSLEYFEMDSDNCPMNPLPTPTGAVIPGFGSTGRWIPNLGLLLSDRSSLYLFKYNTVENKYENPQLIPLDKGSRSYLEKITYSPNGKFFFYMTESDYEPRMCRIEADGTFTPVTITPSAYTLFKSNSGWEKNPIFSPCGRYMFFHMRQSATNIAAYAIPFNQDTGEFGAQVQMPTQWLVDNGLQAVQQDESIVISPDGRWIVIRKNQSGTLGAPGICAFEFDPISFQFIQQCNPPLENIYGPTEDSTSITGLSFSPDGKYFACLCSKGEYLRLYEWDAINKRLGKRITNTGWIKGIAYPDYYRTMAGGYVSMGVGYSSGCRTVWSPDGKSLFITGPGGRDAYYNGVPVFYGFDFHDSVDYNVKFDAPVNIGDVVTASYSVDYIPKDETKVLDVQFSIQFGEGV